MSDDKNILLIEEMNDKYLKDGFDKVKKIQCHNGEYFLLYGDTGLIDTKTDVSMFKNKNSYKELKKNNNNLSLFIMNTRPHTLKIPIKAKSKDHEEIRLTININVQLDNKCLEDYRGFCEDKVFETNNKRIFTTKDMTKYLKERIESETKTSINNVLASNISENGTSDEIKGKLQQHLLKMKNSLIAEILSIRVNYNEYEEKKAERKEIEEKEEAELKKQSFENKKKELKLESDRIDREIKNGQLENEYKKRKEKLDEDLDKLDREISKKNKELQDIENNMKIRIEKMNNDKKEFDEIECSLIAKNAVYGTAVFDTICKFSEFTINYDFEELSIVEYKGNLTEITIPSKFDIDDSERITTMVGSKLFEGIDVKKVIIEDGLETVGPYAFASCKNLSQIDLPSSVTKICEGAFRNCSKLESIIIPVGVECIEDGAFTGCINLKKVSIPSDLEIPEDIPRRCKIVRV